MANISGLLIKDSFDYVIQVDPTTRHVLRIGGVAPNNPIFTLGLTAENNFTYTDGNQQNGYVLTTDALGNATWNNIIYNSFLSGFITGGTYNSSTGVLTLNTVSGSPSMISGFVSSAHTHIINNIVGLQSALDSKSSTGHSHHFSALTTTGHTHVTSEIIGLDSALQDRSLTSHTHSFSALTNTGHTHVTSDITGLDSALQDRSLTGHTHNNLYSLTSHTHSFSALTNTGHTHVTQEVFINKLPSTSDFSLQDFITTSWSCGRISGGTIVDNLDGTITVSGGTGMVRTSDSIDANLIYFEWEANNSLSLADREVNYVYVDYNGGTPIVTSETNYQNINQTTQFAIGTIFKRDNDLFFSDIGLEISNFPRKVQRRIQESFGYQRTSGLLTAHIGVRNVYVTAGVLWYQLNRIDINAFNSSTGDEFTVYYRHPTTGWTFTTGVTQISNTEYDNNDVAPATLGNNNYGVWWVYITPNGEVTILMGQGNYNQLSQAQSATIPVGLPPIIKYYSLFLAKIIIKKNDSAFIDVQLPFDTLIGYTNANNHNELSTLQGGTTDEYYHLTLDQVTNVDNIPNLQIGSFGISIDGSGSVISPGIKGFTMFVNDMTITSWHILSDLSGTCKIDIWKNSTIPTSADTITGTELPELNSQQINSDTNLSTWNTTILANDIVYFNVISATTVTKINLVIKTIKN